MATKKGERTPTDEDVQIAFDRLRGNGAWNGQGLLVHLALTSDGDSSRKWMEPLSDLCQKIVVWDRKGQEGTLTLTEDEVAVMDDLRRYSKKFHAALES